jgi:hypothetical protein
MKKEPMGMQAVVQLESDAAQYGIRRVQDGHGKLRWMVTCSCCGKETSYFNATLSNANQLLNHFVRQGWTFNRKESQFCSTVCVRTDKIKRQHEKREKDREMSTAPLNPVGAISPDPKITRRVIVALEEHFDDQRKLYREGWSDERVAKEAQASLEFVIKYRRDGYGELAEDPEYAKLRDDIHAMDKLFMEQLKKLELSFAAQFNELSSRLARLSKTHKAGG